MRKAVIGIVLLAGLVGCNVSQKLNNGQFAPRYVLPIDHPAIVRIVDKGHCSGFVVSPHVIVTAAHCVTSGKPSLESGEPLNILHAGVEGTAEDFAILWVFKERKEWLNMKTTELEPFDPLVQVSRNPQTFALPLTFISPYFDGSLLLRGKVRPGDSGSAVLDENNNVVAVMYAKFNQAEVALAVPIGLVLEKLRELKVEPPPVQWQ